MAARQAVGAENLCHQAIVMDHASGAVTKISVTVVPEARTAVASFFLTSSRHDEGGAALPSGTPVRDYWHFLLPICLI